ncbi:MAG: hypothetical protein KGY81_02385, partial [Phycisphaerae bacterium]|nr:hypothetical protein [Phycisphaerae bacterium]
MPTSRNVWIAWTLLATVAATTTAQTPRGANNAPPSGEPASAAETAPSAKPTPPAAGEDEETATAEVAGPPEAQADIRFQFDGVPYTRVVRRFAQMAGKPLIGDLNIDGELTFFDAQPYTYEDALDTLNLLLAMKGYVLREEGRFLRLRPLAEIASTTRILRGMDEVDDDIRPNEIVTVVLPMKFLDPDKAAKTVIRMVSSFGSIAPLGQGRGIVITDQVSNIRRIQDLLAALDVETVVDRQLKTYFLKNANAGDVANILTNLFGSKTARKWRYDPKTKRIVPGRADPSKVVQVSHDDRTNMVVLVGAGDKLALAEQMITTLDGAEGPTAGDMRIFELKNARAGELVRTIQELVKRRGRGKGGQQTRVVADASTNRLIVSAAVDDMKQIGELIRELDAASTDRESLRVFELTTADASQLAGTIRKAVVRRDARGRVQRPLATSADERTNTLIVSGPAGDIEAASRLIEQLDRQEPQQTSLEIHVVQLDAGNARQVASALSRILAEKTKGRDPGEPRPRIEVESDTNSLIIATAADDWATVSNVLKDLQASATVKTPVTRLVKLEHAAARELADTLQQAVRSRSWGRRGKGSVPIYVVASQANNALLVTAAESEQAELAQMIAALDVPASETTEPFTMIRLATADAEDLAGKIRALMPGDTRGRGAEVFIEADRLTNSVLLRAPEAKREQIEGIVAKLDAATQAAARETRIVPLEQTSAAAMRTMLEDLYPDATGNRRRGRRDTGEDPERVVITAAPHDKALIIEAPKKRIEPIAQLARTLDAEGEVGKLQVRTYQLDTGSAADVAQSMARLFAEKRRGRQAPGQPQPRFEADRASNQLMIAATADDFARIESLIKDLQQTSKLASQTRTFTLRFAKAEEIAEMLRSILLEDRGAGRRRWWDPNAGKTAMRIAAMESANAVIVQGPPERLTLAEELIVSFDTEESAERFRREVRTYQLKSGNAGDVARSLSRLFAEQRGRRGRSDEPQARFEADRTTNQVMVSATGEQFKEIDKLIAELQTKSELAYQTKTYRLTYARAEEIASMLERVLLSDSGTSRRRWWEADAGKSPFRVSTVSSSNAVVLQGTPEKLAMADELISTFDTETTADLSTIRVVSLTNAQAETLAQSVTTSLAERGRRDGTAAQQVTVTPETNSNSVLVRGPVEKVAEVVRMIEGLDAESVSEDIEVRVYALKNSNAKDLADDLRGMFGDLIRQQRRSRRRGESTPFSVAADERTNSLVVSTTAAYFAPVEQMLQQLDGEEKAHRDVELVFLENADASDVASQLDGMFRDRTWSERPVVQYDYTANTVTMIGNDADLKLMMQVVGKLDQAAASKSVAVRVVPLDGVRAAKMAEMLQRLYGQMTDRKVILTETLPAGEQPPPEPLHGVDPAGTQSPAESADDETANADPTGRSTEVKQADTDAAPPGETKIFEPSPQRVVIAVDPKSNSLLLSGPRRDLDELEMLISELSWGTAAADAELRVFDIENADPANVATTLDLLFNPQTPQRRGRRLVMPEPNITVVAEPRTRRVIVRAKPLDFEVIKPVIKQLDTVATVVSEVRVFTLKNSQADTVATNLRKLFESSEDTPRGRRRTPQQLRRQQVRQMIELRGADGETRVDAGATVSITANERSNSVVVAAPSDAMKLIAGLVQELDQSAAETNQPTVRLYPLKHAEVPATVTALREIFSRQARRGGRRGPEQPPVQISGDEAARTVIVSAVGEQQELIADVIEELDRAQGADAFAVKVYPLEYAQANQAASALNQAMGTNRGRRGRGTGKLRISAESSNHSLIVRASQADHERIAALIAKMDASHAAAEPVRLP